MVKKLSQVELQNQTLHMEVKQARNASELLKHEKGELQDKLQNSADALGKRDKECETLHSRFEKLVADFQESEKEVSKARSSLKTERDKAVAMIERLSQQIEVIEGEKKDYKERAKKCETELATQSKTMRQLEKNQEESQKLFKKLMAKIDSYKQKLEAKGEEGSAAKLQQLEKERLQLQEVNIQLQTRLQEFEGELRNKSAESQATIPCLDKDSEVETELTDLRMELSERDEQIEQLSEQLEAEFVEKGQLQSKYDKLVAESAQFVLEGQGDKAPSGLAGPSDLEEKIKDASRNIEALQTQLTNEATRAKQAEETLKEEITERQKLVGRVQELDGQLHIAMEEKEQTSKVHEDTKNLMELLQGKNKEVEKLQSEMKRIEADRISLMEQFGNAQADVDALKDQLKETEDSKSTLHGDLECVLQSKLDLEESAKQTTTELMTVKSELELLRKASQSATTTAEEEAKKEAAKKEVHLLQAQVQKVQAMYTEDMFKKEQLLAAEHEKIADLERKFANLQSKLTQKEEDIAKKEQESKEKVQEMTQQMEQLGQKVERGEKELKRMRTELKSSQDNYDALEIKHMQSVEESKQQQKSQQEQLELMGRRIQDLTSKLGTAERKVRELTSVEAGWNSFGGGSSDMNISGDHVGEMTGMGMGTPHSLQSSGIRSQLKEVEQILGNAENCIQRQHHKANALEGKIESVEKQMEAIEQGHPCSSVSSFDHDISLNSSSSPSCHSSNNQLAGAAASATKPAEISDTSDTSDCPSSDGAEGGPSKIKILESRLAEMEKKLKEVTHRLVDVTTRELEKRKAYQTKCVSENRLKDQVRGLQREVLALRQQMEKVQSHSESSARHTHSVLTQCRQHLMRIQPTKIQQSMGHGATDSSGAPKGSTNLPANASDKHASHSFNMFAHVTDACHTLDKALDLLISQLKSLDMRKRKSLTEFSESVILGLSGDSLFISNGENPKSPLSCPTSPLFFATSPPTSPATSPRGSKQVGKTSELHMGQLFKFPGISPQRADPLSVSSDKLLKIRFDNCLLEVELLNSILEEMSGSVPSKDEILKLLSCHPMIAAEDRSALLDRRPCADSDIILESPFKDAESEFLAMKEPAEPTGVVGSNEISTVYSACTTFFTSNWELSHSLEKQLEETCDTLAKVLAEETVLKKHEASLDSKVTLPMHDQTGRPVTQRTTGKDDSGLGLDSDLAAFAEGIAYEEALRVAMECVSSELVLAEALQCVNFTIEDFVRRIDCEEQKMKQLLTVLKPVCIHRFNLIRDAIARQLEATSGLIRQKYWDYLQDSEDDVEENVEESKRNRKKVKKQSKENNQSTSWKHVDGERGEEMENEITVLILMKAILSGLILHLRSELSLLAEGNSNQNNDGGLQFNIVGNLVFPGQNAEYTSLASGGTNEKEEWGGIRDCRENTQRSRSSTLESITAEHSRNMAMVRERYEAIIKGERSVHEQELIHLRQRLTTADAAVQKLEEDIGKIKKKNSMALDSESLQSVIQGGQKEIRHAQEQLHFIRLDIVELVGCHEKHLAHISKGIQAIVACYQRELEKLHIIYQARIAEAEEKRLRDLANTQQGHQREIAEMELQHKEKTKQLLEEAKVSPEPDAQG